MINFDGLIDVDQIENQPALEVAESGKYPRPQSRSIVTPHVDYCLVTCDLWVTVS